MEGKVNGRKGLYLPFTVTFRPATTVEVYAYNKKPRHTAELELSADADFIHAHLVTWTHEEILSIGAIRNLHHLAIARLINLITGYALEEQEAAEKN